MSLAFRDSRAARACRDRGSRLPLLGGNGETDVQPQRLLVHVGPDALGCVRADVVSGVHLFCVGDVHVDASGLGAGLLGSAVAVDDVGTLEPEAAQVRRDVLGPGASGLSDARRHHPLIRKANSEWAAA